MSKLHDTIIGTTEKTVQFEGIQVEGLDTGFIEVDRSIVVDQIEATDSFLFAGQSPFHVDDVEHIVKKAILQIVVFLITGC